MSDIEKAFNYSDEFSGDKLVVPLVVAREHVAALTAENARLKAEVESLRLDRDEARSLYRVEQKQTAALRAALDAERGQG